MANSFTKNGSSEKYSNVLPLSGVRSILIPGANKICFLLARTSSPIAIPICSDTSLFQVAAKHFGVSGEWKYFNSPLVARFQLE